MIRFHYHQKQEINYSDRLEDLFHKPVESFVWIDLVEATQEEILGVEKRFEIELFTRQEAEEIESSSKYSEINDEINVNSNFLFRTEDGYRNEAVSFILRRNFLITQRNVHLKTFEDMHRKVKANNGSKISNYLIFLAIFEIRIDFDADFLENIAREVSEISRDLTLNRNLDEQMLIKINSYQETTMLIRENIVDKQRIISSILKSDVFPKEEYEKVRIMIKDVGSLLDHTQFNFERLEYLQNTFLGLVNIEQNKIIKIFTVVTVVFMPPTLIASLYGMNFRFMPELGQIWGYPFALALMLLSSGGTLLYFKKKNWL